MDTGASIAPYNHFELGQPILIDYVWGARLGRTRSTPSSFVDHGLVGLTFAGRAYDDDPRRD
jgi:hypothetical protein